jgi:hypothetical protein
MKRAAKERDEIPPDTAPEEINGPGPEVERSVQKHAERRAAAPVHAPVEGGKFPENAGTSDAPPPTADDLTGQLADLARKSPKERQKILAALVAAGVIKPSDMGSGTAEKKPAARRNK